MAVQNAEIAELVTLVSPGLVGVRDLKGNEISPELWTNYIAVRTMTSKPRHASYKLDSWKQFRLVVVE